MPNPAYQDILDGVRGFYQDLPLVKYGQAAERFGGAVKDAFQHPINTLEEQFPGLAGMLGMHGPAAVPAGDTPKDNPWHNQMVREANEGFRRQAYRDALAKKARK